MSRRLGTLRGALRRTREPLPNHCTGLTCLQRSGWSRCFSLPSHPGETPGPSGDGRRLFPRWSPYPSEPLFPWQLPKQSGRAREPGAGGCGALEAKGDSRDPESYQNPSSAKEGSWTIPERRFGVRGHGQCSSYGAYMPSATRTTASSLSTIHSTHPNQTEARADYNWYGSAGGTCHPPCPHISSLHCGGGGENSEN